MGRRPGPARGSRGRDDLSLELAVGSLADTGEGSAVGPDGARWLVPGALPGETVRAAPEGARRARLLAVLVPSGSRVEPVCPVARVCGGCDLMHLALPEQHAFHARRLAELCGRTLGRAAVPEPRVLAPGAALGYRSRARLHVRADARGVVLGYRAPRSHALVPVRACAVLEPALELAFAELAVLLAGAHGTGEVALARGARGARVYDLRWQGELAAASYARLDAAVRAGELAGARVWLGGAREPLSFGDARPRMLGPDGRELVLAAGAFAQPSDAGALALAEAVRALAARVAPGRPALELFAGSGTLTVALAPETGALEAVESEPASLACLRDNLRARGLAVRARQADANAFAVPRAVELVVLDPPRAGAPGAVEHIATSRARHVVYVSCAPMTLARDAARLAAAGFALRELVSVELFPQTEHAEAIAWLAR